MTRLQFLCIVATGVRNEPFETFCLEHFKAKKILITGADGFVAGYLLPLLSEAKADVLGVGLSPSPRYIDYSYRACDLRDINAVRELVLTFKPEFVVHLASQSSVGTSWTSEWETIESNVQTAHNLMRALENLGTKVRVLAVSSGEVYGSCDGRKAAITDHLKPLNPYAVSKAMMEVMLHRFQNSNVDFIIARAFSHTGAGRPTRFFEASVASQFAHAYDAGLSEVTLAVGNLEVVRDYSDVREVVRKYGWLLAAGTSGGVYNVCSGEGLPLRGLIEILEHISGVEAKIEVDAARLRRNDLPYLVGENSLQDVFSSQDFPLEACLRDLMTSFSRRYC